MSRLRILLAVFGMSFAMTACAQRDYIVLRNPTTGETRTCNVNSGASFFPLVQIAADNSATQNCATGYQAAGWQRMN